MHILIVGPSGRINCYAFESPEKGAAVFDFNLKAGNFAHIIHPSDVELFAAGRILSGDQLYDKSELFGKTASKRIA